MLPKVGKGQQIQEGYYDKYTQYTYMRNFMRNMKLLLMLKQMKGPNMFISTTFGLIIRATLHMRLRACDHYTSSTLIDGKGGASPSSLHTTLEGPMEYVNARWM